MATVTLRSLIKDNDYTLEIVSLQNGINRAKIDTAVGNAGYTLPLTNKVSFHYVGGDSKIYVVTWLPIAGVYGYAKLTLVYGGELSCLRIYIWLAVHLR